MIHLFTKKIAVFFAVCSSLLFMNACKESGWVESDSYILEYRKINGIRLHNPLSDMKFVYEERDGVTVKDTLYKKGVMDANWHFGIVTDEKYSYLSEGEDAKMYEELCKKNGDTTFDGGFYIYEWDQHSTYTPNVARIDVFCNKAFDAEHPAGSSLSDLVKVSYYSYNNIIKSNYTERERKYYMKSFLSDLTPDDFWLLDNLIGPLEFVKAPDLQEEYSITVQLTTDTGEVYTDTVRMNCW